MKKAIVSLLLILVIVLGIGGYQWWREEQIQQAQEESIIRTTEVECGSLEITVSTSGNVVANQKVDLRFETPGTVSKINVEVGEQVKTGQELAHLDTGDLERAVRQTQIALEQAKVNLKQLTDPAREEDLELAQLAINEAAQALEVARIGKESAQSESQEMMRQAQQNRDQAFDLYQKDKDRPWGENLRLAYLEAEGQVGITQVNAEYKLQQSQDQWLTAYNRYLQAKDNLQQLEEGPDENQIRQAELQIEQAELNLEQAQENLNQAILRAPFNGVVATVNIQEDVQTPTTLPAFTLVDDSNFYVDITVDETDISKVSTTMPVIVTLDAYPNLEFEGTVERIAPASTDIGGIVAYPVRVYLTPQDDAAILEGMTASVIIQTSQLDNILLVPNWAIRTDQTTGETYVYCKCPTEEGTSIQRFDITIGARNESFTQVLGGLEEGATVALVVEERNLLEFRGPPSR